VMRLLFLTDLSLLWLSLVAQSRGHRFSNFDTCNVLSPNQKKPVLHDLHARVYFNTIQALTVTVDTHIIGANLFPR